MSHGEPVVQQKTVKVSEMEKFITHKFKRRYRHTFKNNRKVKAGCRK